MNDLKTRIKKILLDKGMTAKELSEKVGMTEQGFGKMIGRENIKYSSLKKISHVLNVPVEELTKNDINEISEHDNNTFSFELIKQLKRENEELRKDKEFLKTMLEK